MNVSYSDTDAQIATRKVIFFSKFYSLRIIEMSIVFSEFLFQEAVIHNPQRSLP